MAHEVDQQVFDELIRNRSMIILALASKTVREGIESFVLTRPLLSIISSESTQLEEFLDAYGARRNSQWYPFRMHVAALKNFSSAGYELLHLLHTAQSYDFQGEHKFFYNDTLGALNYVSSFIYCSLQHLLEDNDRMGWDAPEEVLGFDFAEKLPPGRLPRNRYGESQVGSAQQLVIRLATAFLNNTEDARFLQVASRATAPKWKGLDYNTLSEAVIRAQEGNFHTLQSLYDTYVSDSNIESEDETLLKLRGHISVVLHVLRVATIFVHFYERHFRINADVMFCRHNCSLGGDWFLEVLSHYLCRYSYEFLSSARGLCQQMLRRYAVIDTVEVLVPAFFGFHVRPSTLITSIVQHYGSEVSMILPPAKPGEPEQIYDARYTMNIFLANEWINSVKRRFVYEKLEELGGAEVEAQVEQGVISMEKGIHKMLGLLVERKYIRVLTYPLPINGLIPSSEDGVKLVEELQSIIATLQAKRVINILMDIKVKFKGDIRVLNDIKVLAENGYGENETGANIPLPLELSYLKHSRSMI